MPFSLTVKQAVVACFVLGASAGLVARLQAQANGTASNPLDRQSKSQSIGMERASVYPWSITMPLGVSPKRSSRLQP